VKIWKLPANGLNQDITEAQHTFDFGSDVVTKLSFHPTTSDLLAVGQRTKTLALYDLSQTQQVCEFKAEQHLSDIVSMTWNQDGTVLASSCKDKYLRLFDVRSADKLLAVRFYQMVLFYRHC